MNLIVEIARYWGWLGLVPEEVVAENDFGNVIVRATDGRYWRIIPEECECLVVAEDRASLDRLSHDPDFLHDWYMRQLVELAREALGALPQGRKYCLKIPGILGGEYAAHNLGTASLHEIVGIAGDIAQKIQNLPDGAAIQLKVVD